MALYFVGVPWYQYAVVKAVTADSVGVSVASNEYLSHCRHHLFGLIL